MGCFTQHGAPVGVCPACGYNEAAAELSPHQLRPRTILNGKYLIGKMFGQGGFGITYAGWDMNLNIKIAVKEFYPTGFVTRECTATNTVQSFTGSQGDFFVKGREKFMGEAQTLAKFRNLPGIVAVNDFFQENSTAYIVMEFIEGQTMKEYLAQMGGRLPADQVFMMMTPVMDALVDVHEAGIIHRDISPDNIMISKKGNMKLLDFGAAREFADSGNKSLSIMLKPGYAPEEQYRSKGLQGPWTDIYALCASMYKCMTGVTPEDSNERVRADDVKPPSALGVSINPAQEAALMKGMAVLQENRFANVQELRRALQPGSEGKFTLPDRPTGVATLDTPPLPAAPVYTGVPPQPVRKPKTALIASITGGICVAAIAAVLLVWQPWDSDGGYSPERRRRDAAAETPDTEVADVTEIADNFAEKLNRGILRFLSLGDDATIIYNDEGYITKIITDWESEFEFEYDFDAQKINVNVTGYHDYDDYYERYEYLRVLEYNSEGYIVVSTDYYSDGGTHRAEYDAKGNNIRSVSAYRDEDGIERISYESETEYDAKGNRIRDISKYYDRDGSVNSTYEYEYEYDRNDNEVWSRATGYDRGGSIDWRQEYTYEYNNNGNLIKETSWDGGSIISTTEYEYDRNGNRSKSTRYDASGMVTGWTDFEYEYVSDEWGWWRQVRATGYDANGNAEWRSDDDGYWSRWDDEDYYYDNRDWDEPDGEYPPDDPWGWDEWDEEGTETEAWDDWGW
jgi:hypothetical protein